MIEGDRILVTGGAGFIGSAVAERLATDNFVTVFDNFSTGKRENLATVPDQVIDGDVRDQAALVSVLEGHDTVVHLAAMMGVRRTLENPQEVVRVNVGGLRSVLNAAVRTGVDRVLVASTSEVYGDAPAVPYSEGDTKDPKTTYASAKLDGEGLTRQIASKADFDYTILRYFNVYGPRQDASEYGYVVPIFVRQALSNSPITVHGDGDQTRDFTYISDAVTATVAALGPAGRNETFNVGTGSETSIHELAQTVKRSVDATAITHVEHPRPYVVRRRCADIEKVRTELSYDPQYDLSEGIDRMLERHAAE